MMPRIGDHLRRGAREEAMLAEHIGAAQHANFKSRRLVAFDQETHRVLAVGPHRVDRELCRSHALHYLQSEDRTR